MNDFRDIASMAARIDRLARLLAGRVDTLYQKYTGMILPQPNDKQLELWL